MNWPALKEKLDLYERLMRLDKPNRGYDYMALLFIKVFCFN